MSHADQKDLLESAGWSLSSFSQHSLFSSVFLSAGPSAALSADTYRRHRDLTHAGGQARFWCLVPYWYGSEVWECIPTTVTDTVSGAQPSLPPPPSNLQNLNSLQVFHKLAALSERANKSKPVPYVLSCSEWWVGRLVLTHWWKVALIHSYVVTSRSGLKAGPSRAVQGESRISETGQINKPVSHSMALWPPLSHLFSYLLRC